MTLFVAPAPLTITPPPALPATLVLPEASRPIQQFSTVLPPDSMRTPAPAKRLITRLRISEPPLPEPRKSPLAPAPAEVPLSWIRVAPPVAPSMVTGPVTVGRADNGVMVGVAVPRLKLIVSAPASAFASWIAARSVQEPVPSLQTPLPGEESPPSPVELT